jgi:hypothetical protein
MTGVLNEAPMPMGWPGADCEKLNLISAGKGPPVNPLKSVPGVQTPTTKIFSKPGGAASFVIDVLVKLPNALLLNIRPVGLVMLNVTDPNICGGLLTKMPDWLKFVWRLPSVKLVAVLMLFVSAESGPKLIKPWPPDGTGVANATVGKTRAKNANSTTRLISSP